MREGLLEGRKDYWKEGRNIERKGGRTEGLLKGRKDY
jgi:hypothetical protein